MKTQRRDAARVQPLSDRSTYSFSPRQAKEAVCFVCTRATRGWVLRNGMPICRGCMRGLE